MIPRATVLAVEDDHAMRDLLEEELTEAGFRVVTASDGREAIQQLSRGPVDVVVTDLQMPGMKGRDLLDYVRTHEPGLPVIIITAFGSIDGAVDAMRAGAYHFLPKPFNMEQLLAVIGEALQAKSLQRELQQLGEASATASALTASKSHAMKKAIDLVARAAPVDTPVLLEGETGTGKEMFARILHTENPSRTGALVAVNCSAIPEALLESQLFGYRRGAFTDAREDRRGLFQEAEKGTILLDEIGDMPMSLQGKLLRVLQEREVHPLGAAVPVPIDVRVVAATHRDLAKLVQEGRFRQDLYYRLNIIVIRIPSLRERHEDLTSLIAFFLRKHGPRLNRPDCTVSAEALDALRRHSWPGNVRELENVIERALVLGRGQEIGVADLPESVRGEWAASDAGDDLRPVALVEREHILRTLRAVGGNKASAARLLGLDRKTLYRKLKQYKIEP